MKYLLQLTFMARSGLGSVPYRSMLLGFGLAWGATVWANPPLYVCPGPLFTNDLAPAQAKARKCELAVLGRWSQAQDIPSQAKAVAENESRPHLVTTSPSPTSAKSWGAALSGSSTATLVTATNPPWPASAAPAEGQAKTSSRKTPASMPDDERQRQRDSHAREVVMAELARTQARIQTLSAQSPSGPETESALQRLRLDEDALRRELARRPG